MKFFSGLVSAIVTLFGFFIVYLPAYILGHLYQMLKDGWRDGNDITFMS